MLFPPANPRFDSASITISHGSVPFSLTTPYSPPQRRIFATESSVDPLSTTTTCAGRGSAPRSDSRQGMVSCALFQLRTTTPNEGVVFVMSVSYTHLRAHE